MSLTRAPRDTALSWQAYLDWESRQSMRHEFVDGQVRAMTGGTSEHDTIANNLRGELRERLRGGPCRVHGADLKVRAGENARYPDALVDCGPRVRGSVLAIEPVAIFEILSRSTAWLDTGLKLRDYDATPSVRTYVLFDQSEPRALVYRRDGTGRLSHAALSVVEGADAVLELTDLGVSIPFSRIYEDVASDK